MNMNKTCFLVILLLFGSYHTDAQTVNGIKCVEANLRIKSTLERGNPLLLALNENRTGIGIDFSARETMKRLSIKHATGDVAFKYSDGALTLKIDNVAFYNRYYSFANPLAKESKQISGLEDELRVSFFHLATLVLSGISIPPHSGIPPNSCGVLYMNILDEACLPDRTTVPRIVPCEQFEREMKERHLSIEK